MKATKAEQKWINELQAVIDKCPSKRLTSYTIGDNFITFVHEKKVEDQLGTYPQHREPDYCIAAQEANAEIGSITFPFSVQSTAG